MAVTIIYDNASRTILVINPELSRRDGSVIMPPNTDAAVATISDAEAAKFSQAGSFRLDPNGQTVIVTPPGPNDVEVERSAAQADLAATYQAARTRLQAIANAGSPTNAQVVAAVQDLATNQMRMLRFLKSQTT